MKSSSTPASYNLSDPSPAVIPQDLGRVCEIYILHLGVIILYLYQLLSLSVNYHLLQMEASQMRAVLWV